LKKELATLRGHSRRIFRRRSSGSRRRIFTPNRSRTRRFSRIVARVTGKVRSATGVIGSRFRALRRRIADLIRLRKIRSRTTRLQKAWSRLYQPRCRFCRQTKTRLRGLPTALSRWWHRLWQGTKRLLKRIPGFRRDDNRPAPIQPNVPTPDNLFQRRAYPGSRARRYEVHLPRHYSDGKPLPLVMVLHGCGQRSADIRAVSNFDAIADREKFIVVYPYVTGYSGMRLNDCWGWWLRQETSPGAGEVEDLWQIAEEVQARYNVDPRRVHVTGLSSGGGMAVAAMVVHSGRFASGATIAGMPYSETLNAMSYGPGTKPRFKPVEEVADSMNAVMGEAKRPVPIFVIHSHNDAIVDIQAAANIRDSWSHCFDIELTAGASHRTATTNGLAWTHSRYPGNTRQSQIETLLVNGGGHGWFGGNKGSYSYPNGPDASRLIWNFFRDHPLEAQASFRREVARMLGAA